MKSVEVKYAIELEDVDFELYLREAHDMGCDHSDAGPIESVRRLLIESGTGAVDEGWLRGAVKVRRLGE